MQLFNPRFTKLLGQHKLEIARIGNKYYIDDADEPAVALLKKQSVKLNLFYAGYKCQLCSSEEDLQLHHLIERPNKQFFVNDKGRYLAVRWYWANSVILCHSCHKKTHGIIGTQSDKTMCIDSKLIAKIKRWFESEEKKVTKCN